jgi:hypothetical protein
MKSGVGNAMHLGQIIGNVGFGLIFVLLLGELRSWWTSEGASTSPAAWTQRKRMFFRSAQWATGLAAVLACMATIFVYASSMRYPFIDHGLIEEHLVSSLAGLAFLLFFASKVARAKNLSLSRVIACAVGTVVIALLVTSGAVFSVID